MLDYVHAHPQLAKTQIVRWLLSLFQSIYRSNHTLQILYGQSIGGAVAIDLAYRNPQAVSKMRLSAPLHATYLLSASTQITALIVENTFMSLPRLIPSAMPWLGPFSFLCHQKWESYLKVTFQSLPFGFGVN